MQKIFLVWYDNQEQYIEDHTRYILKAFRSRTKAEEFIKEHCSEEFKPSMTFEQFQQGCVLIHTRTAILGASIKVLYDRFIKKEKAEHLDTRDPSKLEIEEIGLEDTETFCLHLSEIYEVDVLEGGSRILRGTFNVVNSSGTVVKTVFRDVSESTGYEPILELIGQSCDKEGNPI